MCRVNWLDPIIHFVINWVHLTLVEPEVGCYHLGCEGDVAGSLEPSINLVVARHGGFLLCSEK
jgi:hypothetical protein